MKNPIKMLTLPLCKYNKSTKEFEKPIQEIPISVLPPDSDEPVFQFSTYSDLGGSGSPLRKMFPDIILN
jgi:hypothetical protein